MLVGSSNYARNHLKDCAICPIISDNSLKQTIQQSRPLHVGLARESRQNLNFSEGVSKPIVFFIWSKSLDELVNTKKRRAMRERGRNWERKHRKKICNVLCCNGRRLAWTCRGRLVAGSDRGLDTVPTTNKPLRNSFITGPRPLKDLWCSCLIGNLCATAVIGSAQTSCTKRENRTNSIPTKQRRFGDTLKLSYSTLYQTTSVTVCVYNIVLKWSSGCLKVCTVCAIVLRSRRREIDRAPGERSGRQQDAARGRLWWQAFHTTFEWWPFRSINTFDTTFVLCWSIVRHLGIRRAVCTTDKYLSMNSTCWVVVMPPLPGVSCR